MTMKRKRPPTFFTPEADAELVPRDELQPEEEEMPPKNQIDVPEVAVEEFPKTTTDDNMSNKPKTTEKTTLTKVPVTTILNGGTPIRSFEEVLTPRPQVKDPRGPKLAFQKVTSTTTRDNTIKTTTNSDNFETTTLVDPGIHTLATLVYATEQIGEDFLEDTTTETSTDRNHERTTTPKSTRTTTTTNNNGIDQTTFPVTPVQDSWTWQEVDPDLLIHQDDLRDPIMIEVKEPTTFSWEQFNDIKGNTYMSSS